MICAKATYKRKTRRRSSATSRPLSCHPFAGDPRLLAARQRRHLLKRRVAAEAHRAEVGPDVERLGGGELPLERLQRGEGEVELVDVVLTESAHAQPRGAGDAAAARLEVADDDLEERRLADAVGPDEGDARAHVEAEVDTREKGRLAGVAKRDVHHLQDRRRDRLGRREGEAKGRVLEDLGHTLHPVHCLDARLHHGGAVGRGAKLVDEGLHVLPRLVLRLAPRLVGAQRLGAGDLELVVVALVPHDLLVAREV
mmetsp:Transcript_36214/g.113705  ORF Transcript_36214/g.113705 Transcript_36214/m.113705 type:complete len:255 (+) Transcript_36214:3-767(+)